MASSTVTSTPELKYAGFWIRFLAQIIDSIIIGVASSLLFGSSASSVANADGMMSVNVNLTGWQTLVPVLYIILFWIWKGATPGKMALGLRIVQENGEKLGWGRAIGRYFAYFVSAFALCIGFLWIGFDSKKQGWHDKLAKTVVIKK